MSAPCTREKGHFDGASFAVGGITFGALAFVTTMLVTVAVLPSPKGHEILWRTETGVSCQVDKLYPQADCDALLKDLGPRLSLVLPVKS